MARFDWYEGTSWTADQDELVEALSRSEPMALVVPDRAMHGYHHGAALKLGMDTLATVWWGGNPGVHFKASSARSPWLADVVRGVSPSNLCSRVDVCEDWVEAGLFDHMAAAAIAYAREHRIVINQMGDWARGVARTLYLGSSSSELRVVIYEKGYEAGGSPHWVRLEVRAKCKDKGVREWLGRCEPGEVFGMGWVRGYVMDCLGWEHVSRVGMGPRHVPSTRDNVLLSLVRQYGAILEALAEDVGGWDSLGGAIRERMERVRVEEAEMKAFLRDRMRRGADVYLASSVA